MTHSCEIAEAIPRSTPTGESARGQWRVGGHDGYPGAAVLLQSCSAGPGRRARPRPSRQARRLALQRHPWRAAQHLSRGLHDWPGLGRRTWPEPQACHETELAPAKAGVDRLLSNPMINVDDILMRWVPYVVGARNAIVVALDWTDFDADKQATIMVSLITDHCLPRRKPAPGLRSGQAPDVIRGPGAVP